MSETNLTKQIKISLAKRHLGMDFFATEVKTGPTYGNNHLFKFDGLAIKKSWTQPCITGYEIKVSRSDFTSDTKYCCYLPYCHEMYFVCPKGMIKKDEIPTEFGLIYYNKDTNTLRTVKKAQYRQIDVSGDMLMYIIMNKLDSDRIPFYNSKKEYAVDYINEKDMRYIIGKELGSVLSNENANLHFELSKLRNAKSAIEDIEEIKHFLRSEYGIYSTDILDSIKSLVRNPVTKELRSLIRAAKNLSDILDDYEDSIK